MTPSLSTVWHRGLFWIVCLGLLAGLALGRVPSPHAWASSSTKVDLNANLNPVGNESNESSAQGNLGQSVTSLKLADYRGKDWSLDDVPADHALVIAFIGTECPLAKLYTGRLITLAKEYQSKKVSFIAVDSNAQDSTTELGHFAKKYQIPFPLLKDAGNRVADLLGAQRTPEVFVLDSKRVIRYQGRIDNQFDIGIQRNQAQRHDLKEALADVLAGKKVRVPYTKVPGCLIGKAKKPDPNAKITYTKHIAPILQKRCVECHRDGQIAPFALTDYDEVAGWADMIDEVVHDRRMPPWHANPKHGAFSNDASMTDAEKKLVHQWAQAGAPKGDPADMPKPAKYAQGWRLPKDEKIHVYKMPKTFQVPAEGEVKYQYFVVDPGFKKDVWVKAAEARAGNPEVVHHILVIVKPPRRKGLFGLKTTTSSEFIRSDFLVATAPGAPAMILPPGSAKLIPAGSQLIFQMHYTPNGRKCEDRSEVGLVFADADKVTDQVVTIKASTRRGLLIPAGASDHQEQATKFLFQDATLLRMFPHMHLRGKSFRYQAIYPNGDQEILLDVPRYDFNWQNSYILKEPKKLKRGTKIICTAHYDNSKDNPWNPDPTKNVRWGDQTWDEMMIGYFDVAIARPKKDSKE